MSVIPAGLGWFARAGFLFRARTTICSTQRVNYRQSRGETKKQAKGNPTMLYPSLRPCNCALATTSATMVRHHQRAPSAKLFEKKRTSLALNKNIILIPRETCSCSLFLPHRSSPLFFSHSFYSFRSFSFPSPALAHNFLSTFPVLGKTNCLAGSTQSLFLPHSLLTSSTAHRESHTDDLFIPTG